MDTYEQKEKKELQRMSTLAQNYQQSTLGEQEIDRFLFTRNSIPIEGSQEQQTRERLIDMMMVDTVSAEALKEDFPDLYNEAKRKTERLQTQANPGTMQKIKNDFWGSKKRSAREKLNDIADNRKKVLFKSVKKNALDQLDEVAVQARAEISAAQRIINDNGRSPEEKDAAKKKKEIENYRLTQALGYTPENPPAPELVARNREAATAYKTLDRLEATKDYRVNLKFRQDELLKESNLSTNVLYRDTGWFTSKYKREGQFTDDELKSITDAVYVVNNGKHIQLVNEGREAEPGEKMSALLTLKDKLAEKAEEMRNYQNLHPEFFGNTINIDSAADNYIDLGRAFKMLQVTENVAKECIKGRNSVFNDMEVEARREMVELAVYLTTAKKAVQTQIARLTRYADDPKTATSYEKEYPLEEGFRYADLLEESRQQYSENMPR